MENLEQTAAALKDFAASDVTVAFEIASQQAPFHIPLFGSLIGLLNAQGSPLPLAILTRLWARLGAALGAERNLKTAKCLVRCPVFYCPYDK